MERRGWVQRHPENDRVQVTYKVLELAFQATPTRALVPVAAPLMQELAHLLDQSCHLVVISGQSGLVVHRQENPGPTGFAVRQGSEIRLLHSCSGNVLMAFSHPKAREQMLRDLGALSAQELKIYHKHLDLVRVQGYELKPSVRTLGVTDISYPIFGREGALLAALTVPFMQHIDGSQSIDKEMARKSLEKTATRIMSGLGGHVPFRDEDTA